MKFQQLKKIVTNTPILLKIYLVFFPPKRKVINKKLNELRVFIKKYKLSSLRIEDNTAFFKSGLGAWFAYVENWGAYDNEYGKMHELFEIKFVIDILPNNGVLIDIGANYGVFSLNIAKARNDIMIFAFEPVKNTFTFLNKNIKINNLEERVISFQNAIGENEGLLKIENNRHTNNQIIFDDREQLSTLIKHEEVKATTIDNIVKLNNIKNVSFIKIDVEGFEKSVLLGAMQTIKSFKPILLLELYDGHLNKFGSSKAEIINFLKDLGYLLSQPDGFAENNYLFDYYDQNNINEI